MYKKDVPPVFEPEERFLSILKGNRMRPATVGAQGASIFASILVDNDGHVLEQVAQVFRPLAR